ncbi:MAG: cell division protein FtsL [bacterium]
MSFFSKRVFKSEDEDEQYAEDIKLPGRWTVFGIMVLAAMFTVLYVDNVIRVDGYLADIQKLKKKKEYFKNENELLMTKLNYLQSPERISKIAEEKLGMIKVDAPPEIIFTK